MRRLLRSALIALLLAPAVSPQAKADDLAAAEAAFWESASDKEHAGLLSAYLLHFPEGRFAAAAAQLFQEETGQAWTTGTAAQAAWREPGHVAQTVSGNTLLTGRWTHTAVCDINLLTQDIQIESSQIFRAAGNGALTGDSSFRHSARFHGAGKILELRVRGDLMTYVMQAENNITGTEVHIGILNVQATGGVLRTRGWEMNTAGAYCDMSGEKLP